ncbi:MAG: hypothetical protein PHT19_12620 [Methylococcus sp.]|nr:hypothetical protein [Methylococcus sp.]
MAPLYQICDITLFRLSKHFTEEEELMLESKLDARHVNIHRMEHRSFSYDIAKMRDYLSAAGSLAELAEKIVRFVTSWLTYHILGIDQVMAAQIFAIQEGATPEQAYEAKHLVTYDEAIARLMLDSVLDLWQSSVQHCNRLEEKLAALEQRAKGNEHLAALALQHVKLNPLFITNQQGAHLYAVLPINEYSTIAQSIKIVSSTSEKKR